MKKLFVLFFFLPLIVMGQQDVLNNGMDTTVTPAKIRRITVSPTGALSINPASQTAGLTTEVLLASAGCTTLTNLAGRKSLGLQNCGPNDITCSLGGSCPSAGTALVVPAKASGVCGFFAMDVGPAVTVKCIAATAPQVSGAATIQIELGP